MAFRIQIEEVRTLRKMKPREWLQGADGDKWGYAPEVETLVTERIERLDQTVDSLDLIKVIRAINGIEE